MTDDLKGWAGKLLHVDLTAGETTVEESWPFLPQRIGAIGLGLAQIWDRVPAGCGALDPENVLFIGVGPLTGSWAPCAGRAIAVSLSPAGYPVEHVGQGSVGGQWPAELKWAGYDGLVITGRSATPVFLAIHNDVVSLLDATELWGLDTWTTQRAMQDAVNDPRAKALVIGPAGEKQARNAAMIHGTGHALGQCGFGAVAGSKNLKGIVVRGTGRVLTATSLADFRPRLDEIRGMLALMQSVIPSTEDDRSRWRAREGLYWRGGDEEIPIGHIAPDELTRQGMRHCGMDFYMDGLLVDWHVKNSGCTGCVMNCFSTVRGAGLPDGIPSHGEMHCVQSHTSYFLRSRDGMPVAESSRQAVLAGKQLADLFGINAYDIKMMLPLMMQLRYGHGGAYLDACDTHLQEQVLALPWDSMDEGGDGGVAFVQTLLESLRDTDPAEDSLGAALLQGTPRAAERLGMIDDLWSGENGQDDGFEGFTVKYAAHGQRDHYGPQRYGLPAGLHWVIWNRDPNRHEHNGLVRWSGLSWEQKRRVAEIHFGDRDVLDDPDQYWGAGPATPARIELARMLAVRSMLKDSLTVCDWVFPNYCCPDPAREYAGDLGLEAELYRAVTGDEVTADELDQRAEALVDLYRAITVRCWNTADLRGGEGYAGGDYRGHDNLAAWYFDAPDGTPRLDRGEFEAAKVLLYERLGWDPQTGGLTRSKLEALGQPEVADGLAALGLLIED